MFDWKSSSPGELTWIFFSHVRSMYNKTLRCQNTWTSWENQMKWKVVKVSTTSDPIVFWSNYSSRKALQRNQNKRAVSLIKMEDAPAVSVSAGFWPRRQLLTAILSVFFLSLSSTILVIHSTLFLFSYTQSDIHLKTTVHHIEILWEFVLALFMFRTE